jgi:hypothetical protein
MSYRVLISEPDAFAVIALSGVVVWDDAAAAMRALYAHPAWTPSVHVLWDARAITALDIPPTDLPAIRALLAETAASRAGGRSAVLVKNDVVATLAMLFARMAPPTGRMTRTFDRLEDALRFLGRPALPTEAEVVASSETAPAPSRPSPATHPSAPRAGTAPARGSP